MKKLLLRFVIVSGMVLGLTGCQAGAGQRDRVEPPVEAVKQDTEEPEPKEKTSEPALSLDAEKPEPDEMPAEIYFVENPEDGYYQEAETKPAFQQDFALKLLSEQKNEITDEEAWFSENQLRVPSFPYTDENYEYRVEGEAAYSLIYLRLEDLKKEKPEMKLDFSAYQYANDFEEKDRDYAEQRILWAKAEDGILYVSLAHNTYAETSPHTAYMAAIDLSGKKVIWKSEALMCNSKTFEIIGDSIVCGYGFTQEKDYLNILDKGTGKLQKQIPLKTKPEYIIRSGNVLYVRTYDTDYRFEMEKKK